MRKKQHTRNRIRGAGAESAQQRAEKITVRPKEGA